MKQAVSKTPKHPLTFNGLCGVISQKIETFLITAVRPSFSALLSLLLLFPSVFFSFFGATAPI
jgi:hypothetical protein